MDSKLADLILDKLLFPDLKAKPATSKRISAYILPVLLLHLTDEQKQRVTMYINRKIAEQVDVDWTRDPTNIKDSDIGKILDVYICEYFGGVTRILVPDSMQCVM